MQRRGGGGILLLLLLLLAFGTGFGGENPNKGDDDDGDDGLGPCPDGYKFTGAWLKLRRDLQRDGHRGKALHDKLREALAAGTVERCELAPEKPDVVIPGGPTGPKGDDDDKPDPLIFIPGVLDFDPKPADVDTITKDYCTPATFHQVKAGETWLGKSMMMTRYASSALYMAAKEVGGLDNDAALEWASSGGRNAHDAQVELAKIVACTPINDVRYGTYAIGANDIVGATGRAIRLAATATPDHDRIRAAQPMGRNVPLGKPGDPLSLSMEGVDPNFHARPFLWLPGIDLELLWQSNGYQWRPGGKWKAGTSKIAPPPAIYALGVTDYTNSSNELWGCAPWATEIGA